MEIKSYNNFLLEGKINDLIDLYSDKNTDYEIENLKSYSKNSYANLEWLLKNYTKDKLIYGKNIAGEFILLDVLDDYFKRYLRIKKNLPIDKRDINLLKSTKELIDIVNTYNDYDNMLDDKDLEIITDNLKWVVFIPKTFKASNKWGWNRFCTSNNEDSFKFHNINNMSLVYIKHKFDYTKNTVIECLPQKEYVVWNYQDDNTDCNYYYLSEILDDIDDGFLDIEEIIDNLPNITLQDMKKHLFNLLFDLKLDYINEILDSEFEEKDYNQITKKANSFNIYELRSLIRSYV